MRKYSTTTLVSTVYIAEAKYFAQTIYTKSLDNAARREGRITI